MEAGDIPVCSECTDKALYYYYLGLCFRKFREDEAKDQLQPLMVMAVERCVRKMVAPLGRKVRKS